MDFSVRSIGLNFAKLATKVPGSGEKSTKLFRLTAFYCPYWVLYPKNRSMA